MKFISSSICSRVCLVTLFSLQCVTLHAQPPMLENRLRELARPHKGLVAIAVKDLSTGESAFVKPDVPMPTASLIKVAVMIEAYRQADAGMLDLSQQVTLKEEDKVPGSGILTKQFSPGLKLSIRDAIRLMIAISDNTATNLVIDQIGLDTTAKTMEQLEFPNTKLHAKVYRGTTSIFPERSKEFGLGSTTANEMLQLLEQLHNGELASKKSTAEMMDHLRACENTNRLPKLLPAKTVIAHKTGSVNAARTDAGIIVSPSGPLIVVVLTAKNEDQRWTDNNAANLLAARIAKLAYDHFNPDLPVEHEAPRELSEGAEGWLVEALQRTLNDRMTPSPGLSVDGDFGAVTKQVVVDFQKSQELPTTGIVGEKMWKTLGPLITSDVAITDPKQFGLTLAEKQPIDSLDGVPFVTCKAWIVGDAASGEIVGGEELDQKLANASTTKLMTAWIAMREVRKNPTLLDQLVTVSHRASETPGSTAMVQVGEKLTVRDLLYGLLLPSGNDASVVFAEHFGERFSPPGNKPEADDSLVKFVAEMNRTALQLGMMNTQFRNPHGLSAADHRTTVRDMFRLASKIVEEGSLLPYVQTRKHIGRLESTSGYVRYELWTNTNRLLNTDGYLGMKTGTTRDAGACLVSLAERDGVRRIAVVLGSTSGDARYVDTRNLFRWSWNQE